jgi:hypothetical protein
VVNLEDGHPDVCAAMETAMSTPKKTTGKDRFLQRQEAQASYMHEQTKERQARQAKTERLRELRLAKEAEEKAAAAAAPKKPAPKRKPAAVVATAGLKPRLSRQT